MTIALKSCVLLALAAAVVCQYSYPPYNHEKNESPIWKVFCDNLYGGRLDTIVNPGKYSGHVHRVFGGSNFGSGTQNRTAIEQYNVMYHSPCTTCSLRTVDNSAYWTPDLYYRWPNNTYSLVPTGGLTVYYLSRGGSTGTQRTDPNWRAIPKGLRMLAGNPFRRTYNSSLVEHMAIDYVCLNYANQGFPQSPDWSGLKNHTCPQGLRTQVFFPMCWDGVNLDSPNHQSHMAYPERPNGGDCPATHPVRIPGVFFEHIYQVGNFPHGDGTNNFVWSMGDNTGFGLHGDFLGAWDEQVMAAAIKDPECSNDNYKMDNGNNVRACPPLAPFVKNSTEPKCRGLSNPVPLTENLGAFRPISRMPGCYGYNGDVANCDKTPAGSDNAGTYFIKSASNGKYLTAVPDNAVYATHDGVSKSYSETWAFGAAPNGQVTIQNQQEFDVVSAQVTASLIGGNRADLWEYWTIVYINSTNVAFRANRTGGYLTLESDNTLSFRATAVTSRQIFVLENNNGGYVPTNDGFDALATVPAVSPLTPTQTTAPSTPATVSPTGSSVSQSDIISIQSKSLGLYVRSNSSGVLTADATSGQKFVITTSARSGWNIKVRSSSLYVQAAAGGASALVATSANAGSWEDFELQYQGSGYWAINATINRRLVVVQADGSLLASATSVSEASLWAIYFGVIYTPVNGNIPASLSSVVIKSKSLGSYVNVNSGSATYSLQLQANSYQNNAQTYTLSTSNGQTSIKAEYNNNFVSANNGGSDYLVANRGSAGGWETFTVTEYSAGYYVIVAVNGNFVRVKSDGRLLADSTVVADDTLFTFATSS